jgi:hypothetical protein
MRANIVMASLVLGLLAFAIAVRASVVEEGSLPDDVRGAEFVLDATISAVSTREDGTGVWTVYGLDTIDTLKGTGTPPHEIALYGGHRADGSLVEIDGMPHFTTGDRVVLLLRFDNPYCPIIGLGLRAFRADTRDAHGARTVTTVDRRPLTTAPPSGLNVRAMAASDSTVTLDRFKAALRSVIRDARESPTP